MCIVVDNLLEPLLDLAPDITIGVTIGLIINNVYRARQAGHHLNIEGRLSLSRRWFAVNRHSLQFALKINAFKVVLDIVLIETVYLDQVHRHIFPMPAMIPKIIVAISMHHLLWEQCPVEWGTILCRAFCCARQIEMLRCKRMLWGGTVVINPGHRNYGVSHEFRQLRTRRRRATSAAPIFIHNKMRLEQFSEGTGPGINTQIGA